MKNTFIRTPSSHDMYLMNITDKFPPWWVFVMPAGHDDDEDDDDDDDEDDDAGSSVLTVSLRPHPHSLRSIESCTCTNSVT